MKNQFKKILKLLKTHDVFVSGEWGNGTKGKTWAFCPLATAAVELGLDRRKLINTIKKSYDLVEDLVFDYMESHGFSKNKSAIFLRIWDIIKYEKNKDLLSVDDSLKFAALMADKYDFEIKNDADYTNLKSLFREEFMNFMGTKSIQFIDNQAEPTI